MAARRRHYRSRWADTRPTADWTDFEIGELRNALACGLDFYFLRPLLPRHPLRDIFAKRDELLRQGARRARLI